MQLNLFEQIQTFAQIDIAMCRKFLPIYNAYITSQQDISLFKSYFIPSLQFSTCISLSL